jgi:hypothetical protein
MRHDFEITLRAEHAAQTLQNYGMPVCNHHASVPHVVFAPFANCLK